MMTNPLLTAAEKLSVKVNGLLVPFNLAVDALRRHSYPLLHYVDIGNKIDLGYAGTTLLVQQDNRLFQIFSNHQLTNFNIDPTDALIYRDERPDEQALGPCEVISVSVASSAYANLNDIKLVRYESGTLPERLKSRFLQNSLLDMSNLSEVPTKAVQILFTVGFPMHECETDISIDDDTGEITRTHVKTRSMKLYLQLTEPIALDPPNRIALEVSDRFEVPAGFDFNGFSGAPVFFIWLDDQKNAQLGFAGMIVETFMSSRLLLFPGDQIQKVLRDV